MSALGACGGCVCVSEGVCVSVRCECERAAYTEDKTPRKPLPYPPPPIRVCKGRTSSWTRLFLTTPPLSPSHTTTTTAAIATIDTIDTIDISAFRRVR